MIDISARSGTTDSQTPAPSANFVAAEVSQDTPFVVEPVPKGQRVKARLIVLTVIGGILGYLMLEVFLLPVAARQRQDHLRDEYAIARADLQDGEASLLLQIPAIGVDQVVTQGATPEMLRGGPGWRSGSAPPGQGNTVILGHSTRWGYPFGAIDALAGGDRIYVRTRDARVYAYKVTKVQTVDADDTRFLRAGGTSRLTLVSSAGGPLDGRRVIVQASPNGAQPEVPEDLVVDVSNSKHVGSYDERTSGGVVLLFAGVLVLVIGVFSYRELRRRYAISTALIVAGPAVALGVILFVFNLDAFLPITY